MNKITTAKKPTTTMNGVANTSKILRALTDIQHHGKMMQAGDPGGSRSRATRYGCPLRQHGSQ